MVNKRTTLTRISVSKELSFSSRYEYTLRNNSFFSMTNQLENGKWCAFEIKLGKRKSANIKGI